MTDHQMLNQKSTPGRSVAEERRHAAVIRDAQDGPPWFDLRLMRRTGWLDAQSGWRVSQRPSLLEEHGASSAPGRPAQPRAADKLRHGRLAWMRRAVRAHAQKLEPGS